MSTPLDLVELYNPNIERQMLEWQQQRINSGQDPCDWAAFRTHDLTIAGTDPGPLNLFAYASVNLCRPAGQPQPVPEPPPPTSWPIQPGVPGGPVANWTPGITVEQKIFGLPIYVWLAGGFGGFLLWRVMFAKGKREFEGG